MAAQTNLAGQDLRTGTCPICGSKVDEIRRVGHWRGESGGGFWYSGRCVSCDVDFRLDTGIKPVEWRIVAPEAESLRSIAAEAELESVSEKLSRYKIRGAKWRQFLARRRPGDEVWWFSSEEGQAGAAVVRGGKPIASFVVNHPNT